MTFSLKMWLLPLAVATVGLQAQAQTQAPQPDARSFVELGLMSLSVSGNDGAMRLKARPGVLTVAAGYRVHPNVTLEGVAGVGIQDSTFKLNGVDTGVKLTAGHVGAFVRPTWRASDKVELFGRLGYVVTRVKASGAGMSNTESEGSFAVGLGLNVQVSTRSYLQATWTQTHNKDDIRMSGFGLAYGWQF